MEVSDDPPVCPVSAGGGWFPHRPKSCRQNRKEDMRFIRCCHTVLFLKLNKSSLIIYAAKNTHLLLLNDTFSLLSGLNYPSCMLITLITIT